VSVFAARFCALSCFYCEHLQLSTSKNGLDERGNVYQSSANSRMATRKLELRGDIAASYMRSRSTTPLLRNPTGVRHCSQHAGANVDFGDEGAVDWAFLGNLKQLRALLLG
jgi:hypothetical protein